MTDTDDRRVKLLRKQRALLMQGIEIRTRGVMTQWTRALMQNNHDLLKIARLNSEEDKLVEGGSQ